MNRLGASTVFFLGIGGIGMSAIARYFLHHKKRVLGYDKTPSSLTDRLQEEGAEIFFNDDPAELQRLLSDADAADLLVVITPAVPKDSQLSVYIRENQFLTLKRSEVLGEISATMPTIAVAGTHGKTTTTTLIAHVLQVAGVKFNAFLGGISNNFNSNLVLHNDAKWMVVEADEFDRSFLTLHPSIAVVTSVDADHLDIYGDVKTFQSGFSDFIAKLKADGTLICHQQAYRQLGLSRPALTYCLDCNAMYSATEIMSAEGMFQFSIVSGIDERQFALSIPGLHNVQNALAAYLVAKQLGISDVVINKAFMSFAGIERRFHYQVRTRDLVYIDDYAHHPTEISAVYDSLRFMYPERKITAIFQPHLFTRTRDFMDGFAASLSEFDEVLLLDIYPARELPIEGVTSDALAAKMKGRPVKRLGKEQVNDYLLRSETEVVLTIGAGDIDRLVEPIRQTLLKKVSTS
ncbi:MAG TPA: UDP-N-acetylmuramate--L-alanine ligase [Luteibaculaceae bacterium]|nr:UDP-N-acetylmuramate--L-alanine ligase [Luteibaculaceae bacterium]